MRIKNLVFILSKSKKSLKKSQFPGVAADPGLAEARASASTVGTACRAVQGPCGAFYGADEASVKNLRRLVLELQWYPGRGSWGGYGLGGLGSPLPLRSLPDIPIFYYRINRSVSQE